MRRPSLATGTVLALLALTACSGSSGADAAADTAVTFALAGDPGSLNPLTNATATGEQLAAFGYESLVSFPAGRDPEGAIAASWQETPTSISFTLKKGVTCTDGSTLTASDVKATFAYAAAPATASPFVGVDIPTGVKITADDAAGTVAFTVPTAQSFLLQSVGALPIVCGAGLKDPKTLDTKIYGTGPYALTTSVAGQSYTFALRSGYATGPGSVTATTKGLPQTVTVQVVTSDATRANLLQQQEVDLAEVGGTDRDRLDGGAYTTVDVPAGPGQLFFNQASARATHALAVRRALAQAVDRDAVGKVSTSGRGTAIVNLASSLSTVCLGIDSSAAIPTHDTAAAAALLDQAGWTLGADGVRSKDGKALTLKILYKADAGSGVTAGVELVQEELAAVGVKAVLSPASSYTDVIFSGGDWDVVWAPISVDLPSTWAGVLSGEFPPKGGNWTYNTNQAYFDLTARAQKASGDASCALWKQAQDALLTDVEVLPIYESTSTVYGSGLTFGVSTAGLVLPTSLRTTS